MRCYLLYQYQYCSIVLPPPSNNDHVNQFGYTRNDNVVGNLAIKSLILIFK